MVAENLMLDDWVIRKGIPIEPMQIAGFDKFRNLVYMDFQGRGITENLDGIEPIPLTPEILEKNGFTYYDVGHKTMGWSIMDKEYFSSLIPFTLTDNDFDTETGEYKWGPVEDDREESFVREMGRIHYVHELQHVIKVCKVDKKIII